MKALLLFWHGIGDLICLTPALRALHAKGYHCDILCLPYVAESHVMDACPYVTLLPLSTNVSPSVGGKEGKEIKKLFLEECAAKKGYDAVFKFGKGPNKVLGGKIQRNLGVCGLPLDTNPELEVFISQESENTAKEYISLMFPDGFIFQHTRPGYHKVHDWDARQWMKENLPPLPVIDTGRGGRSSQGRLSHNISVYFVLAREATHRVLSSSVFVHACDAMDVTMDVVYYGAENVQGMPLDADKILLVKNHAS